MSTGHGNLDSIEVHETIDCIQDILHLLLSLKGCIDTATDELLDGQFDFIYFATRFQEITSDWADLMEIYAQFEWANEDLEFEYNNFVQIWKEILTIFVGHSLDWCIQHQMLISQFLSRVNELQAKYIDELMRLKENVIEN